MSINVHTSKRRVRGAAWCMAACRERSLLLKRDGVPYTG